MKSEHQRSSGDLTLGADTGYVTPPEQQQQQQQQKGRGTGRGGRACSQPSGTALPERAAQAQAQAQVQVGMPAEGKGEGERNAEGERSGRGGGGGGGGNKAGKTRGTRSPSAPLEGLHKSGGCFVTPKKVSRRDFGGGVRIMGVSPSSHEPVRIAPMVRRCASIGARHDGDFDHRAELRGTGGGGGGGGDGAAGYADGHDDVTGRGGSGSATAAAASVFGQRGGVEFVVGRSREMGGRAGRAGYSGGAGRGLEAEKKTDAAELVPVGYDEWKEACTAEGKIYYYNRRTRVPRWTLPPTAAYVPDPQRPTGYRIFALAASTVSVAQSSTTTSSAKETGGGVCVAADTVDKGSSHEGPSRALREAGRGGGDGGGGGGDGAQSPPTALLLLSTATPATTAMTAGGTPSSPQSFPQGTASSSPTAATDNTAAQRFVVHKSGLGTPSSQQPAAPTPPSAAPAPAAATVTTPPEPAPATLPTVTTTANDDSGGDDDDDDDDNPVADVPQIDPGGSAAAAAATPTPTAPQLAQATTCLAARTHQESLEPAVAAPSTPRAAAAAGGGRDDERLADEARALPAAQKPAATGLMIGSDAAGLDAGGVVPAGQAAPEGHAEGGDAAGLVVSSSPVADVAAPSPAPDRTGETLPLTAVTAAAPTNVSGDKPARLTRITLAAVEGDGPERLGGPPAVAVDAGVQTPTFATHTGRAVQKEGASKEPAVMSTGGAAAAADAQEDSNCQPPPSRAVDTGEWLLFGAYQEARREDEDQQDDGGDGDREEANGEGGELWPSPSPSPSSSSSSSTLEDFVHTVRAESGGRRRDDGPSSAPSPSPSRDVAGTTMRRVEVGSRGRGKEPGTVRLVGGHEDRAFKKVGMENEEEEEEEVVVFSSGRSPRTLRRRPLGPVRRSEDLGHSLPSPGADTCPSSAHGRKPEPQGPRGATAVQTPTTALAGLPANQARSRSRRQNDARAAAAAAPGAQTHGKTVRLARDGDDGDGGSDVAHDGDGLPVSSVLRHRVRRQLFSEDSEAKPLVFCPFCGEGVMCAGGLQGHLKVCYVLDRCRGGETHKQVEVAIKSVSVETQKHDSATCTPAEVFSPENDSLRGSTTVLQQAAPTFLSQTAATSTGPENFLDPEISNVGEAGPEAARGTGLEFSVGDDGEAAVERCEGCGRTFAPGRLQSHAKACRSVFLERRRPYDLRAMRARGTPLEFFQQSIGASTPDGDGDPPTSTTASGKKGDHGNAPVPASRRAGALGRKKRSPIGGGRSIGQGRKAARDGGDGNHASPGVGAAGRSKARTAATTMTTAKKLPAVEGSARCPFCSSASIPRANLSAHLLRCKRLRSARSAPKVELGSSSVSGASATDTRDTNNSNGGGGGDAGSHATRKVRCPHCDRGFSPSVAPTHISICARVENRPKGTSANPSASASPPSQKAPDTAPGAVLASGSRRMQQEKARVMPPFY